MSEDVCTHQAATLKEAQTRGRAVREGKGKKKEREGNCSREGRTARLIFAKLKVLFCMLQGDHGYSAVINLTPFVVFLFLLQHIASKIAKIETKIFSYLNQKQTFFFL